MQLPELEEPLSRHNIESAGELWLELFCQFERLAQERPLPTDLLARIWRYAIWSATYPDKEVYSAARTFFSKQMKNILYHRDVYPRIMTDSEYTHFFFEGEGTRG